MRRKQIPLIEQLAAALSCLLPQEQRDALRKAKVPALKVRSLFQMDHNVLHAHEGPDVWWNITPLLVAAHREKSRRDTAIVAKVKRLQARIARHPPKKPACKLWGASRSQPRVKKKIAQRPPGASWPPKGSRPLRRSNTRMES